MRSPATSLSGQSARRVPRLVTCLATGLAAVLGAGCASLTEESPIPQDGPTMLEIYRSASADEPAGLGAPNAGAKAVATPCAAQATAAAQAQCLNWRENPQDQSAVGQQTFGNSSAVQPAVRVQQPRYRPPEALNADYMRTASNEIRVLFPRLPNPDIVIFVFPHLATANRVPIPGYSTVMPLYGSVEYAMPGEKRNLDGMD